MDDWSFARPLPPGAFPDEDNLSGAHDAPNRRVRKSKEPAEPPQPLPAD
jgi:hypothetical protein